MNKYKETYRTETIRLKSWDYSWQGVYFVTICTKSREPFFGEIKDENMMLSKIGNIAKDEWFKTTELRPDMNISLGEFVVMPDHIHGIICIGKNKFNARGDAMHCISTTGHCIPTGPFNSTNGTENSNQPSLNTFAPQRKNLASIVRGYKSAVTIQARKTREDFGWQSRFYDRIVRDEEELHRISEYIKDNPRRWGEKHDG